LRPEDVGAIVFRSKNYLPLLPHLAELDALGYGVMFHYTITGLPKVFEPNVPDLPDLFRCARYLSDRYGPDKLLWRCDPVLVSNIMGRENYRDRFSELVSEMEGLTSRCYFCYNIFYKNVIRNLGRLHGEAGIECWDIPREEQIDMAGELADIASAHGITMLSCCGDYLVGGKIGKAHCIDAELLHRLFPDKIGYLPPQPIKKECGCAQCTDIGAYDTCTHGCVYCYANVSTDAALRNHKRHEPDWDMQMQYRKRENEQITQPAPFIDSKPSTLKLPFW
jgi:hypothetical protein